MEEKDEMMVLLQPLQWEPVDAHSLDDHPG
jgi:hypothetical protein